MTSQAFLNRLRFALSFMEKDEIDAIVKYYQNKISLSGTLTGEEEAIKSLGTPEKIAEILKESYYAPKNDIASDKEDESSDTEIGGDDLDSVIDTAIEDDSIELPSPPEENSENDFDIIFTKPLEKPNHEDIIHSIENEEPKPIYGEKVYAKEPAISEEGTQADPEIEIEKIQTLEKAEQFSESLEKEENSENVLITDEKSESEEIESAENDEADSSLENIFTDEEFSEEESFESDEIQIEETANPTKDKKEVLGIFQKAFGKNTSKCKTLTVLFSVLLFPIIAIMFVLPTIVFALCEIVLSALSAVIFLIMVLFAVGGVIEIVYGIITVFTVAVSVGLAEIGIGLCAFGILLFLIAFIYEYLFNITPKFYKYIFSAYKNLLTKFKNFLWGGVE